MSDANKSSYSASTTAYPTFNSPNKLAINWDCPSTTCAGFIEAFKAHNSNDDKPAYARCSHSRYYDGTKCDLPMMFSKKTSTCAVCTNQIDMVSKKLVMCLLTSMQTPSDLIVFYFAYFTGSVYRQGR